MKLTKRSLKGTSATRYYENASIAEIPEHIIENSIIVASSNNGAVQNIVNELPLIKDIEENLIEELKAVDYFKEISNSKIDREWKKNADGKMSSSLKIELQEELYWGQYSLEGGKGDNMNNITNRLESIYDYLKQEYKPDEEIYQDFLKQYDKVSRLRYEAGKMAEQMREYENVTKESAQYHREYSENFAKLQRYLSENLDSTHQKIKEIELTINGMDREHGVLEARRKDLAVSLERQERLYKDKKNEKQGLFAIFNPAKKKKHQVELEELRNRLQVLVNEDEGYRKKINSQENDKVALQNTIEELQRKAQKFKADFESWNQNEKVKILELEDRQNRLKENLNLDVKCLDTSASYEDFQKSGYWFNDDFRVEQSRLFIKALAVRKQFLYENVKHLKAANIIWKTQDEHQENKRLIRAAWHWINMTIPVISSTFASFSRMFRNMEKDSLGHVFVDEAGQALPQAAVGAIFRARHLMVVGDPSQIKPVLTLEGNLLKLLGRYYHVGEKYLSGDSSVQTLVDDCSRYGFYVDEDNWIGIPLWVHRRCQCPMFDISNRISYHGLMVQDTPGIGKVEWFDVSGKATDKYVKEQGEFLKNKLSEMIKENPDIKNKAMKDQVFVITPFRNVAWQLAKTLEDDTIDFTRRDDKYKPTNIGTIHTFQGKEAAIVFLVLGADQQSSGAARWAVQEPNMMNVAATRAKREFYIIGDSKLYMGLGSNVVNQTMKVISEA